MALTLFPSMRRCACGSASLLTHGKRQCLLSSLTLPLMSRPSPSPQHASCSPRLTPLVLHARAVPSHEIRELLGGV